MTGLGRTVFQSKAAFCEAERGPKALEPGELWAIRWPQSREPRDRAPRMQPALLQEPQHVSRGSVNKEQQNLPAAGETRPELGTSCPSSRRALLKHKGLETAT